MLELASIASLPEVKSAVRAHPSGALLDSVRDGDPESTAAVAGFLTTVLGEAGDLVGLGTFRRTAVSGTKGASYIVAQADSVVVARIEPATSVGAFERLVEAALQGKR